MVLFSYESIVNYLNNPKKKPLGINKVMKGEYNEHSEGAAEHASTSTAEAGHTE